MTRGAGLSQQSRQSVCPGDVASVVFRFDGFNIVTARHGAVPVGADRSPPYSG